MIWYVTDQVGNFIEAREHVRYQPIPEHSVALAPPEPQENKFRVWTPNGWEQRDQPATFPTTGTSVTEVNAERDRRLQLDFEFQGKMYQRDTTSLQRITGAATLAGFAVAAGALAGNLRWANPEEDFGWIAADNTVTPMDAQTCFAFGQAAAAVETRLVFAARALRGMNPIPENYQDDIWWG